ncbi:hypothetical protein ES703_104889 [subsurface metagenome]
MQQSEEELKKHLKEHIQFLIDSCKNYDNGNTSEAKRMAVSIRVLLHDTSNSTSLLKQLDKKNILFLDTAYADEPANIPTTGLAAMGIGSSTTYIPLLDNFDNLDGYGRGKIPFKDWWNQIVVVDRNWKKLSRKDIILTVTNKDGGAHIDPELTDDYYDITRLDSLGWKNLDGTPIPGIELASIRQISFEVLKSLEDEFPEFFS